jgi:hypothetical protein
MRWESPRIIIIFIFHSFVLVSSSAAAESMISSNLHFHNQPASALSMKCESSQMSNRRNSIVSTHITKNVNLSFAKFIINSQVEGNEMIHQFLSIFSIFSGVYTPILSIRSQISFIWNCESLRYVLNYN